MCFTRVLSVGGENAPIGEKCASTSAPKGWKWFVYIFPSVIEWNFPKAAKTEAEHERAILLSIAKMRQKKCSAFPPDFYQSSANVLRATFTFLLRASEWIFTRMKNSEWLSTSLFFVSCEANKKEAIVRAAHRDNSFIHSFEMKKEAAPF